MQEVEEIQVKLLGRSSFILFSIFCLSSSILLRAESESVFLILGEHDARSFACEIPIFWVCFHAMEWFFLSTFFSFFWLERQVACTFVKRKLRF